MNAMQQFWAIAFGVNKTETAIGRPFKIKVSIGRPFNIHLLTLTNEGLCGMACRLPNEMEGSKKIRVNGNLL
jgi:hypothetical protein